VGPAGSDNGLWGAGSDKGPSVNRRAFIRLIVLFRDAEAGLDYAEARSYQVPTARFNAPDPVYAGLFEPQLWNRYSYVSNNPLRFVDPRGTLQMAVSCGAGPQWCPGNIQIGPDKWIHSDGQFDWRHYGYQGGQEAAAAEAAYSAAVDRRIASSRAAKQQEGSVTTSETFTLSAAIVVAAAGAFILAAADGPLPLGDALGIALLARFGVGVATAATAIAPSSRALGRALEAAGHSRPVGAAAHHIVAGNAAAAAPGRAVLEKFGIGLNDAANGVFLNPNVHNHIHTNAYYNAVNQALRQATTREEALQSLDAIRRAIVTGQFP
jgi:RHS repeat-associated protein